MIWQCVINVQGVDDSVVCGFGDVVDVEGI